MYMYIEDRLMYGLIFDRITDLPPSFYECTMVKAKHCEWSLNYGSPLVPKQDILLQWMKCVSHKKRCIFKLLRCIIPIWRPPLIE